MTALITDHYTVLGVTPSADRRAIQFAYRALARRCHPDFGGDERTMARINEAWRILGDPEHRAAYDAADARREPADRRQRDGRTVLDFGRYEGWSLPEVARADDAYLEWLARTPLGRPLRREITEVLQERSATLEALRTPVGSSRGKARRA